MTTSTTQQYNSPVNFFIGQDPPDGIKDPVAVSAFQEVYNAIQNIIQALVNNCGIGPQPSSVQLQLAGVPSTLIAGNLNRLYVTASENITFGAVINLFQSGGILQARNANATNNTKPADGYCSSTVGILAGAIGEVQLGHGLTSFNGLTIGDRYYLSTTNGLVSNAPATAAGNIEQYVGVAIDVSDLFVNLGYWIQH